VIVIAASSREFRVAVSWELLYADDLVIIAHTEAIKLKGLISERITWTNEA